MRKRIYFGKFDKWLTETAYQNTWTSVVVDIFIVVTGYAGFYWLPEIGLFFGGEPMQPARHQWHMVVAGFLCGGILLTTLFKVIRLVMIKKQEK